MKTLHKIVAAGWAAVELGLVLVLLAVLAEIILGGMAGGAIAGIAHNARDFLASLPAGTLVGAGALILLWVLLRRRVSH